MGAVGALNSIIPYWIENINQHYSPTEIIVMIQQLKLINSPRGLCQNCVSLLSLHWIPKYYTGSTFLQETPDLFLFIISFCFPRGIKEESPLSWSHMSLSSTSCAFQRPPNIVGFVSKIYNCLSNSIVAIKMNPAYATTGKECQTPQVEYSTKILCGISGTVTPFHW